MMKFVAILGLGLILSGCMQTIQGGPTKAVVITAPKNLYKCPLPSKPDPKTLTDAKAADYINRLYKARQTCKASLNAIETYSDRAAQTVTQD